MKYVDNVHIYPHRYPYKDFIQMVIFKIFGTLCQTYPFRPIYVLQCRVFTRYSYFRTPSYGILFHHRGFPKIEGV